MNTQPTENWTPSETRDGRLGRRRNRRLAYKGGWIGGAILLALGIILLWQNVTGIDLGNWWALFILIPAVGALGRAWQRTQEASGRLTAEARTALFFGVIMVLVAGALLFGANWTMFGPALLVLVGIVLLVASLYRE
jgi:hypothetical protein